MVYTIGHSNHSLEDFLHLLQQHEITALADVRSHPYSRYLPHFNQKALKIALQQVNIAYVFLGKELGARPEDLSCYVNGKARYENIAATAEFSEGIKRICQGAKQYKIALMCAEKDPITCHRAILVSRALTTKGVKVQHILKTGELENHEDLETRLLRLHGLDQNLPDSQKVVQLNLLQTLDPQPEMSREYLLEKAYNLQGENIAYVDRKNN